MANNLSGAALLGKRVREMLLKKVAETKASNTKASNKKSNMIQGAMGPVSKGHALLGALITGYVPTPRGGTKIGSRTHKRLIEQGYYR